MVRLHKYLAECGIASRRASERLVVEGRVQVNGETAQLGQRIDPGADTVTLDGQPVLQDRKVYVLLNKPKGVITSARDTHERTTVLDCLEGLSARVYPVGRLDMDTEGVLLLTNDGELAHRLTHPRFGVEKVYLARVEGAVSEQTAERLAAGVELEDGPTAPARVRVLSRDARGTLLELALREGRNREVKRMCAAVGHPVRALTRTAFGAVSAKGLRPGEWRYLRESELDRLRRQARLPD